MTDDDHRSVGEAPLGGASLRTADSPLLEVAGVTKRFGALVACEAVDLVVCPGEILGLLGQNGAGKSTLMKIVVGVETPTQGHVKIAGRQIPPGDPAAAAAAGVGMVHQHFSLVESLAVWQNVVLGEHQPLDRAGAIERVREISERYGLEVDPEARVEDLSAGMRQRVEIVKCMRRDPSVIVLDEPTSVLTLAESRRLFSVVRELVKDHGHAAVLISHRLEEILNATDRVTILRDGRVVDNVNTAETDARALARAMLGRDVSLGREAAAVGYTVAQLGTDTGVEMLRPAEPHATATAADDTSTLDVREIVVRGSDGRTLLDRCSLHVVPGEIVGLAGVEGNGQDVLVDVLAGVVKPMSGEVRVRAPGDRGRGDRRDVPLQGIGVVPADRHATGCVLDMTVAENLVLNNFSRVTHRGLLRRGRLDEFASDLVARFDVAAADIHAPMWTLSGGNQQKIVLARELARRPPLLVAAQPTRGLDVGAIEYMWERLREAAAEGTAVLLVSTELDEIIALSHRIAVIHRGRIIGEMPGDDVDIERLGLMMGGQAA